MSEASAREGGAEGAVPASAAAHRVHRPPDDARHSVLRKQRPLSQTSLEAFAAGRTDAAALLPRGDFGTYEVREVDVKTALTKCAMPGEPWTVNPYTGCSHDCGYCYVPDVAHLERPKWGSYVLVKRNLPTVLAREVKIRERRDVFLSSATDPYQPAEATHLLTRRALEILARADWPVAVLTRNPLVRRDVDLFRRFSEFEVGMSVPTLDDEARRRIEPGAPSIEGRLRTLRQLADAGFRPFANLMPCYPLTDGVTPRDLARAFRDAGVAHVTAGAWRYVPSVLPVLRVRLGDLADEFAAKMQDPEYYEKLWAAMEPEFARAGVKLSVAYRRNHVNKADRAPAPPPA